jgi:hypothetical protein
MHYNLRDIHINNNKNSTIIRSKGTSLEIFKEDSNNLEAIVINTTKHELNNGRLKRFLNILNKKSISNAYNIDIYIVFNVITDEEILDLHDLIINNYENLINIIKLDNIISLDIPKRLDFYIKHHTRYLKGRFGNKSGPNYSFFRIMETFSHLNTILLLETDCYINDYYWIDKCYDYVINNKFLISGTYYTGLTKLGPNIVNHLNGVAFYKTGSQNFKIFIRRFRNYLLKSVLRNHRLAYDIAMLNFMEQLKRFGCRSNNKIHQFYYKFLRSNLISNQIITNACIDSFFDMNIRISTLNHIYNNPLIIHTKKNLNLLD